MQTQRRFVNQLRAGESIDQVFQVREKDLRTTKTGDLYITCVLVDRTGPVNARMWQASQAIFNSIPKDGFLHVKGRCEDYRGTLQLVIEACRPIPPDKVTLADFVPVTELDVEAMWSELLEILRPIQDEWLRALIKKFVEDRELVAAFKKTPASMQLHQPFLGGLLEHTLAVARSAKALLPLYPTLNKDLVLAGVFLHDIGKTAELSSGTSMQYTDRGQLIGHIVIAVIWLDEKAKALAAERGESFPVKTLNLLEHILLSHHGSLEFGSPRLPAIPEAFFLHHLDNLDAKIWMTTHQIATDPDTSSSFTPYNRQLETRLYKLSGEL
jgi:3'-5' exoribonuclease